MCSKTEGGNTEPVEVVLLLGLMMSTLLELLLMAVVDTVVDMVDILAEEAVNK